MTPREYIDSIQSCIAILQTLPVETLDDEEADITDHLQRIEAQIVELSDAIEAGII